MSVIDIVQTEDVPGFVRDLLAKIGETTPNLIYAKDRQSRMVFANQAVLEVLGKSWDEIRGKSDVEWHDDPEQARAFVEADARVMTRGESESLEEVLTGTGEPQTFLSTKSPLRAADGRIIGLYGISVNITERKSAEDLRQTLLEELDHRLKNTLAMVHGMARQTLRKSISDPAIWQVFEERLISMAQAHGLLTRQSWDGADIFAIVDAGLKAFGGAGADNFSVSGPSVWIDAPTGLALAMAFHELGTNALKFGALSAASGRVTIAWHIERHSAAPMFNLRWSEIGGPRVCDPAHRGFGSRLIEQSFGQRLGDIARIQYLPGGVEFHVRFKLPVKRVDDDWPLLGEVRRALPISR